MTTHTRSCALAARAAILTAVSVGVFVSSSAWASQPGTSTRDGSAEGSVTPRPEPGSGAADLSPLVHEGILNAPVSEVWKVFSTAEGFKKLGVAQCEMDFRVGGLIKSHYDPKGVIGDAGTIMNRIIAYEPERMIAFRIDTPPKGFPFMDAFKTTWSVATLTDLGDGRTHLRLAGLGYTAEKESQAMREFFKNGNQWTMSKLKAAFDEGEKPRASGSAHEPDPLAIVEHTRVIDAPLSEVYQRFSTSPGWKNFLDVNARIEPVPGGTFEIEFDPDAPLGKRGSEGCTVLSVDPGRMISFSWNAPPKFEFARQQRSWVVVTFEELAPARTRVRLRHLGFAELSARFPEHSKEFVQTRAYFQRAWEMVLDKLSASWPR